MSTSVVPVCQNLIQSPGQTPRQTPEMLVAADVFSYSFPSSCFSNIQH